MLKHEGQASAKEQPTRKAILIVEQDDAIAAFLRILVQEELSHYAVLATDSEKALNLARQVKVDLFLLAYMTTPINGIALYDQLHSIAGLESVPAIIFSTNLPCQQAEIERRQLIGMETPCELDELLDAINSLLATPHESRSHAKVTCK